jgi:hypothetical protein
MCHHPCTQDGIPLSPSTAVPLMATAADSVIEKTYGTHSPVPLFFTAIVAVEAWETPALLTTPSRL